MRYYEEVSISYVFIFSPFYNIEDCLDTWPGIVELGTTCETYNWACDDPNYPWYKDECKKTCGLC